MVVFSWGVCSLDMTLAQHMETRKISTVENNTAVQRQIIQYLLTFSSKHLLSFDFASCVQWVNMAGVFP